MTLRRIDRREDAEQDLLDCANYLAEEGGIDVAFRFLDQAAQAFLRLAEMPEIGAPRSFRSSQLAGARSWPVPDFPKYLVIYVASADRVDILRVLHGARDLDAILGGDEDETLSG